MNPNDMERELNTVRSELYEQTKNMTPRERVAYYKELAAPVRREFGIRTVNEKKADGRQTSH
jgi:hypothetical protein